MATANLDPEQPAAVSASIIEAEDISQHTEHTLKSDVEKHVLAAGQESLDEDEDGIADTEEIHGNSTICYGKYGKTVLWIGIALMWIVFELDHTTIYNYQNYAASEFNEISALGALTTAGTIIIAVMKPPIAKVSDVAGRIETYIAVVAFYVVSYILCATAKSFEQYAGGYVVYSIGATGMQILNQIIVADITSARCRGLANSLVSLPFMIVPWMSAFIVDSALATIGWRWGIGMFAIIMPVASLGIIVPLCYFRRRGKLAGNATPRRPTNAKAFFSAVDSLGIVLLTAGCAMVLLPMALAGNTQGGWTNPWIPTVMAVGVVMLVAFAYYETRCASNPIMPAKYFRSVSLVLACGIGLLDAFAFQVTHTYMYAWSTVVHSFSARDATFLTYTSGCFQVLAGLLTGFLMYRSRRYKWLLVVAVAIRLAGYGAMLRLRGATNPVAELFVVQAIQGLGSGAVGTVVIVIAQVVVPHAELAQATALILLAIFMGQAVGSAVAGGIYTNLFKPRLRVHLGVGAGGAAQAVIDAVFDSIATGALPAQHTPERDAIDAAYSDVLRYMTISALVASALPFLAVWFLPNLRLSDDHNLSRDIEDERRRSGDEASGGGRSRRSTLASVMSVKGWFSRSAEKAKGEKRGPETETETETKAKVRDTV